MKIAIVALKGGVGKTSTTLFLGACFGNTGNKIGILDWDEQGTASKAVKSIGGIELADPNKQYDGLIFDTPPNLENPITHQACSNADVIIAPTSPSPADIWETQRTLAFVEQFSKPCYVLFNKVNPRTILARTYSEEFGDKQLKNVIMDREQYKHFLFLGWKSLDAAAKEEIYKVTLEISGLINK